MNLGSACGAAKDEAQMHGGDGIATSNHTLLDIDAAARRERKTCVCSGVSPVPIIVDSRFVFPPCCSICGAGVVESLGFAVFSSFCGSSPCSNSKPHQLKCGLEQQTHSSYLRTKLGHLGCRHEPAANTWASDMANIN